MKKLIKLLFITGCILGHTAGFTQDIVVVIASQIDVKAIATTETFQECYPNDDIEVLRYKAESGIAEQPIGNKTALKGVRNRINSIPKNLVEQANYLVAIENYIEYSEDYNSWVDVGMVLVIDRTKSGAEQVFLTQPIPIPTRYVELAKELSTEITEEGFSITIGQTIQLDNSSKAIDTHDWTIQKEFGRISRIDLLKECLFKALHPEELTYIKNHITKYQDFPKPGILFEDFTPMLCDAEAFNTCINLFYERYKSKKIDAVVGLESRGFILGAALAYKLGAAFIPVRKPGKLPGPVYTISYTKEYGTDSFSIPHYGLLQDQRVLIIDDLIATGGSAKAAIDLVTLVGGNCVEFASLLEVKGLGGRLKLGIPSFNLID